jgi:hypothetical protein
MGTIVDTIGGYDPAYAEWFTGEYTGMMPVYVMFPEILPLPPPPTIIEGPRSVLSEVTSVAPIEQKKEVEKAAIPYQKSRISGLKTKVGSKSHGTTEKASENEKTALMKAQERTVKTQSEALMGKQLRENVFPFSFETELLGGRTNLRGVSVSYVVNGKAVRFFEQNDSKRAYEKVLLESMGLEVLDVAPSRFTSILAIRESLKDIARRI